MFGLQPAHLQHLHVVDSLRGTGLASRLHERFVRSIRESTTSPATATLKVSRTNNRAIAFYLRHGWRLRSKDKNDPKLDLLELRVKPHTH